MKFQDVEEWITDYYLKPKPELLIDAVIALSDSKKLLEENTVEPLMYFFGSIFSQNLDDFESWITSIFKAISPQEQEMILTSLWLANAQPIRKYLNRFVGDDKSTDANVIEYVKELLASEPPSRSDILITSPLDLDVLWASFMATGDRSYVIKIISSLDLPGNNDGKALVENSALWSLKANAKRNSDVKKICIEQKDKSAPKIADCLDDVING